VIKKINRAIKVIKEINSLTAIINTAYSDKQSM